MTEASAAPAEEEEKPRTVLVGNIPRGTSKRDLEEIFGDVGPLKRLHLQYPREDKRGGRKDDETLMAYVTFALSTDAATTIETLGSSLKISGKRVFLKLVKPGTKKEEMEGQRSAAANRPPRRNPRDSKDEEGHEGNPNRIPVEGHEPHEKPQRPPKGPNKQSRLIVRNLSFKATEEKVREHFGVCGSLTEVNILKKPDGRMVGCAFVQFDNVPQAAKAVRDLNLKPFLGRPIAIDWALPKNAFQGQPTPSEVKDEAEDVKPEVVDLETEDSAATEKAKGHQKENPYAYLGEDALKPKKEEAEDSEDSEEEVDDDEEDSDAPSKERRQPSKEKADDIAEGKTLFIRNVPFSATQELISDIFKPYGELVYALLVVDPLTEHPKGTAFVKYKDAASATACLTSFNVTPNQFNLDGRRLSVTSALSRTQVTSKTSEESSKSKSSDPSVKKDSRNLYLGREGFIRPGSSAAEGVSASDLNKRASLAQTKKQLLRNLAVFLSPERLCIHNLPEHFTDKALRKLFKQHAPPTARLTEARIMRDLKDPDLKGKGRSKCFGFVTFTEHEHALAALRTVNNNPDIFGPNQRPIVEFSLENRKAIVAKERRLLKSQENNPRKQPAPQETSEEVPEGPQGPAKRPKGSKGPFKPSKNANPPKVVSTGSEVTSKTSASLAKFSGLKGLPGVSKLPAVKAKGSSSKITRKSLRGKTIKKKILERRKREKQMKPKVASAPVKKDSTERHIARHSASIKKMSKGLKQSGGAKGKRGKWAST